MSDQNLAPDEQDQRIRRSERIGAWENEGGSVCAAPWMDETSRYHSAVDCAADTALLQALPLGILTTRQDGSITYSNPACQRLYAASAAELLGQSWCHFIDPSDQSAIRDQWQAITDERHLLSFEVCLITGTGQRIWTRYSIASLAPNGAADGYIHTIEDISAIKASERAVKVATDALSSERERARVTLESIGDAVISTDSSGRVTYLNAVAEDLTGWSREAACGRAFSQVFRVVDSNSGEPASNPAERAMQSLEIIQMPPNCMLLRPDGSELAIEDSAAPILDAQGELVGAVVIFRDRKMSRATTAQMAHMARHDVLTGLPNRFAFAEHFNQAIHLAQRHHHRVGLLFIDLDNFKWVNDTLGHKVGDRLLGELSRKLTFCVRSTDLVGRHGGDEFVVLLSEIKRPEDAGRVAAKMQAAAAAPIHVDGQAVQLNLSIGISVYPEDGTDARLLMHHADVAMYHAKRRCGGGYAFYHGGLEENHVPGSNKKAANVRQRTDRTAHPADHADRP